MYNPDPKLKLHYGDLTDGRISKLIEEIEPTEVYNWVTKSQEYHLMSQYIAQTVGMGALRMLEAIRNVTGSNSTIKFYQASSSEIFGKVKEIPQNEDTPFYPRSPYACSKSSCFSSSLIIGKHMECMLQTEYYLITKAQEG